MAAAGGFMAAVGMPLAAALAPAVSLQAIAGFNAPPVLIHNQSHS
jgi:hypothetical protein